MKDKINDLWLDAVIGVMLIFVASLAIPVAIWEWLNGRFEKPKEKGQEQQEDIGMFHCPNCGNDFEAEQIVENTDGLTARYYNCACPKCGNLATISQSIQRIVCGTPWMSCTI